MTCVSECFADKELETCGCNSVGVYFMPKNITVPCDGVTMVMCPFHQANAMGMIIWLVPLGGRRIGRQGV